MQILHQSIQYPAVTVCMFEDYHESNYQLVVDFENKEEVEEYIKRLNNIVSRHIYFSRLGANGYINIFFE